MIMATNTGPVMTLANSIIGVSLLAMPFCFKQCGIALGILILLLSGVISRLACHFLLKSSVLCRRRNIEFIAFHAFGPSGKVLVEFGIIGFLLGTCVAFFVVIGDLGPAIVSKIFEVPVTYALRSSVLLVVGLFIVLPLGLLRNVSSLAALSTITIGFYFLLVIKIFSESFSHLIAGDWIDDSHFWKPDGVLQCLPIFAMALACQTQIFEIYESLPIPSVDKMNSVVRAAVNISTVVYISVGFLGYIAFPSANFTGNILLNFAPSFTSDLFKFGFVMSLAVSFPLVIFPCRASLYSLLFSKIPIYQELTHGNTHIPDSKFKCITIGIVGVSLATGLIVPSIELVLGFVGSTIGVAICVFFPAVAFMNLNQKETNERQVAKITLIAGMAIMVVGVYGNLYAAAEVKPIELNQIESQIIAEVKVPKPEVISESPKLLKKEEIRNNMVVIEENKSPQLGVLPQIPKQVFNNEPMESKRKEPPVPMAPVEKVESSSQSALKLMKLKIEKQVPNVKEQVEVEEKIVSLEEPKREKVVEVNKVNDNINEDAIKKEDRELQEVEKIQQPAVKEPVTIKPLLDSVKPIKSDKFNENIAKIQSVIDNLKDKNKELAKETQAKQAIEDKIPAAVPVAAKLPIVKVEENVPKPIKSQIVSMPLPLAKLQESKTQDKIASKESVDTKQQALGRDILENENPSKELQELQREKRDADESILNSNENCQKNDFKKVEHYPENENKTQEHKIEVNQNPPLVEMKQNTDSEDKKDIIKNTMHLSLPDESKLSDSKMEDSRSVPDPNLSLVPKKRDLKSLKSNNEKS